MKFANTLDYTSIKTCKCKVRMNTIQSMFFHNLFIRVSFEIGKRFLKQKKSYDKIYVGTCIMIYSNLSATTITVGNGIFCQSMNQNNKNKKIVAFEILFQIHS